MRIKRYEAPTIQEALMKVKKDLGPDAVILYTKTSRKGGLLGLFGRPVAEITAGVDLNLLDDVGKRKNGSSDNEKPSVSKPPADPLKPKTRVLQRELNEMKTTVLSQLLKDVSQTPSLLLSEGFQRLQKRFLKQEVEELLVQRILKNMLEEKIDPENLEEVRVWLESFLERHFQEPTPLLFESTPKILAFVGPTGVGKTTTLAKLAAKFGLMERRKTALITVDTYRIAAAEQLRTYGKIMGLPVEVVETPDELTQVLPRYRSYDLILLDTAGRSPSNTEQMEELKQFIFHGQPDEIYLVMSATTKYSDMLRILERFGAAVPIQRMILTKLDETRSLGSMMNLMVNFQIPVAYLSTGQNVPDDLEVPDARRFASRIAANLVG